MTGDKLTYHARTIPIIVQLEWMAKYGVDVWNKDHYPAVRRLLETDEYKHLKNKRGGQGD